MKKIIVLTTLAVVFLLCASPVLAQDPLDVAIGISGDEVNVDIDIEGNEVNVSVDGVDFKGVASQVSALGQSTGEGSMNTHDWYVYWNKEMKPFAEIMGAHDNLLGLLMDAQAKLIMSKDLTDGQIAKVNSVLESLKSQLALAIETSQQEDAMIMHQLVNGAETHIAFNTALIDRQAQASAHDSSRIDSLEVQVNDLRQYSASYTEWAEGEISKAYQFSELLQFYLLVMSGFFFVTLCGVTVCLVILFKRI